MVKNLAIDCKSISLPKYYTNKEPNDSSTIILNCIIIVTKMAKRKENTNDGVDLTKKGLNAKF